MRFSLVFSLIFENWIFFPHTSILPNIKMSEHKGNFASCSSFQDAFQAEKLMNIFTTLLNETCTVESIHFISQRIFYSQNQLTTNLPCHICDTNKCINFNVCLLTYFSNRLCSSVCAGPLLRPKLPRAASQMVTVLPALCVAGVTVRKQLTCWKLELLYLSDK